MRALRNADAAGDEEAARRIAGMIRAQQQQQQQQPAQPVPQETTIGEDVVGGLESAATFASGIVAEPIAGISGLVQSANPWADEGAGARAVEGVREALTYQPRTEAGQGQVQAVGEFLQPVGEALQTAETTLGEGTLNLTGSPFLATIAHTLPTVALEALGIKGAKGIKAKPKAPSAKQVQKAVVESAPEAAALKNAASAIYQDIDNSDAMIKPKSIDNLVNKIAMKTRKKGLDYRVSEKAAGAVNALKEIKGSPQKLSELAVQREIAKQVAKSPEPPEAMYGNMIIDEIDSFMDELSSADLIRGSADTARKYKSARQLYGRAKRSELITEAIEKSQDTASGSENGLRIELRKIVNNKKKSRYFNKEEIKAMKDVVRGDKGTDTAKFVGTFGFGSGGGAHNLIPALAASTAAVLNPVALAAPAVVGSVARKIANARSLGKTNLVDSIVRAGSDGNRIAKAYLTNVPKSQRSAKDLSELLSDPNIDLDALEGMSNAVLNEAVMIARGNRALAGATLASTAQQETQDR